MALNTKIRGAQIDTAYAGDGLGIASDNLKVNVDDSSIEISADTLQVKALGITNAMLAGSIAYSKLSLTGEILNADLAGSIADGKLVEDYIKTSEVDDSTIEFGASLNVKDDGITNAKLANISQGFVKVGGASDAPTDLDAKTDGYMLIGDGTDVNSVAISGDITIDNAGVTTIGADKVDVGMININNAEVNGYVLTWNDSGYMEWTAKTGGVTEDYLQEAEIKFEDESGNCDGNNTTFTLGSAPVTNSVQVFLNGLLQQEGSGKDYTLTGTTVEFTTAPDTGDILLVHFIAT